MGSVRAGGRQMKEKKNGRGKRERQRKFIQVTGRRICRRCETLQVPCIQWISRDGAEEKEEERRKFNLSQGIFYCSNS